MASWRLCHVSSLTPFAAQPFSVRPGAAIGCARRRTPPRRPTRTMSYTDFTTPARDPPRRAPCRQGGRPSTPPPRAVLARSRGDGGARGRGGSGSAGRAPLPWRCGSGRPGGAVVGGPRPGGMPLGAGAAAAAAAAAAAMAKRGGPVSGEPAGTAAGAFRSPSDGRPRRGLRGVRAYFIVRRRSRCPARRDWRSRIGCGV